MKRFKVLFIILIVLFLCSCADYVTFQQASSIEPVGFWYGLWHGMIIFFSWVFSLFDSDVAIYAVYNNGGWYDFGYILGLGVLGGGASKS